MDNEKLHIRKELKDFDAVMQLELGKQEMPVPEGYFERLETHILQETIYANHAVNIEGRKNTKGKILQLSWIKYISGIAALALLVLATLRIMNNENKTVFEVQLAKMSSGEIDQFINTQLASISAEELNNYLLQNVDEIETEFLFDVNFISDASAEQKITKDVNDQIMAVPSSANSEEILLDEELLKQLDDQTIQDYLNDAALFEDLGL